MCGRYVQSKRARDRAYLLTLRAREVAARPETWNLAPSTSSMVVRSESERPIIDWMIWGLGSAQVRPINARVETASTKPLFRDAWRDRRCVVPADGWYECRTEHGSKQPYYFRRKDDEPLFFAGLWTGGAFCILTTVADGDLAQIHDRRPLALHGGSEKAWIETAPTSAGEAVSNLFPAGDVAFHPVSSRVSSPRNDGPELIVEEKTTSMGRTGELDLFLNSS